MTEEYQIAMYVYIVTTTLQLKSNIQNYGKYSTCFGFFRPPSLKYSTKNYTDGLLMSQMCNNRVKIQVSICLQDVKSVNLRFVSPCVIVQFK
jgi:hypothetical protein